MGNDPTFDGETFNSDAGSDIHFSDDKRSFKVSFGGLGVRLDSDSGSAPIVTRTWSYALALRGTDPGLEIPLVVQGFALTGNGVNGHLLFRVNDQTMLADFPENSNDSFVKQLNYNVGAASELRITIFLLVDRDSKSDAVASLNVTDIQTDLNLKAARG